MAEAIRSGCARNSHSAHSGLPRGLVFAALATLVALTALTGVSGLALGSPAAPPPPADPALGPPFDLAAPTPHRLAFTIDTAPARDVLALLAGAPDAPAALRRLKASVNATAAIRAEGLSPDDFYGRLVSTVAGTPDPLLSTFVAKSPYFSRVLDTLETEGQPAAGLVGRRIASLLPTGTPITATIVLVPFFGVSGFAEVAGARDGGALVLAADLPRLTGDLGSAPMPREMLLKMLRAAAAEAWRALFDAHVRKAPAWPDERAADFDTLLARTAAEGPPTLFLIPDDFFPIVPLLEEPIVRAFARWNRAADVLIEGKRKDSERQELLANAAKGDFWTRYPAIVGAEITDALLRFAGRERYLSALEAGPRAVLSLYLGVTKGKRVPELSKAARKALAAKSP
ncbi:MAG: hypothetical protein NEA02_10245 [Thermoanaerobaculia bacterium]|nr:hypothetical protein [Thermoanaerobaculia bacterium]